MELLIFLFLVFFVRAQLQYKRITRAKYYFLPLFSLFQVFNVFTASKTNFLILGITCVVGFFVGSFQAVYSKIKRQNIPIYFYYDEENNEQKIYRKEVLVKGGKNYLVGWVIIFAVQLLLQYLFVSRTVDIQSGLFQELLGDISDVYLIQSLEKNTSSWYAWALYGFSSLFYYFALCKKFPVVKEILLHTDAEFLD